MAKRVAITGFSFRFPGTDTNRYWQDLLDGRDLVTKVAPERWSQDTLFHPNKRHAGTSYTFAAGTVGDIASFDAGFFGISPREASQMDPQQRFLLEMSWEALENSGIAPSSIRGSQCGVFIGIASADYAYRLADDLCTIDSSIATGNTSSIAANRISYIYDLHGPSMAVDTACSSSLVAFHQACRSILSGECIQSFAGGISLHIHPYGFITFSKATMLSPRGRCNVFDASGDGYVRSEGGGVVFLKDYDQAIADGNPILAVVANSSINMDGHKSGLTVPNAKAQEILLKQSYRNAGIKPDEIDYLEAHGTGTAVGDPIEAEAIGNALGKKRSSLNPLLIGSVKSNIGHLEAASGIAGLIKALYCLQHRVVPATIGFVTPNPHIQFDELNIEIATKKHVLKKDGKIIVGVNSFGFGGANAHVILESHEQTEKRVFRHKESKLLPITLSAKTNAALKDSAQAFSLFLKQHEPSEFYDIAYNSNFYREQLSHRLIVFGIDTQSISHELDCFANDTHSLGLDTGVALKAPKGPAFMYSGNGSQWHGMGKQLLEQEPIFRKAVEEVNDIFRQYADFSLIDELLAQGEEGRYEYTEIAQPALFALQVGITQMLKHRGLLPVAVAGHSVGEIAAAWAAGILTLDDAVKVIFHRSKLQGETKGRGAMTAVGLGNDATQELLSDLGLATKLTVAGVNSSRGVTLAGNPESLLQLESALDLRKVFQKRLAIDYAFHSQAMDEIKTPVKEALAKLQPRKAAIPFYSSVTGKVIEGQKLNASYWWKNIRNPVLFEQAINGIIATGINIFLEVGPHTVLRSYISTCLKDNGIEGRIFSTANSKNNSPDRVWSACNQAILSGATVDWRPLFPSPGKFIQLPNYPWQRDRHWHGSTSESLGLLSKDIVHPLLGFAHQQHDFIWENKIDPELQPSLADHVVGGATVFPGSGFSELILAAAIAWLPGELAEIENLEIRSPLLLQSNITKLTRVSIDAYDGSVTIKGRDYCSSDPWTLHATARILVAPGTILLDATVPVPPDRPADFYRADHERLTRKADLNYGPAFQCIDHGWVDDNSALAIFKIPECIEQELEQYYLHPAILDCTFQLIIQVVKKEVGSRPGFTFVPVRIGRMTFQRSLTSPAFAKATVLRCTPHSMTAAFTIYDDSGSPIATASEVRFRSVRLGKQAADALRFLDYHAIPKPHFLTPVCNSVILFKKVLSTVIELAKCATLESSQRRYSDEVDPLLDVLCSQFTRETLQQLSSNGHKLLSEELQHNRTADSEIGPFLDHLLATAVEDQIIVPVVDGWEILPNASETSAQDIWNSLITDYPDFFDIVHSVGRVGLHLGSILQGSHTNTELISSDATQSKLTNQVVGADIRQRTGQALQEFITRGLTHLPEGRRLGIIEIRSGAPSFAEDVCSAMDSNCCDYYFASNSSCTLESCSQLKERFPCINTRLIETESATPDAAPSCQLAVVTIDFSTPEETMTALRYARSCLVPCGTLIVIGLHPSRWMDFVFGNRPGHWSYAENGSLLSSQCTASFWKLQLQQLDFTGVSTFELSTDSLSGPYLLVAKQTDDLLAPAPSERTMPSSWIIVADQQGLSAQLSNKLTTVLQTKGDIVIQTPPADTATLQSLLQDTTASYGQLDGIIHLAGLDQSKVVSKVDGFLDHQVSRCTTAVNIVQACEQSQNETTLWLITTNGVHDLLPKRNSLSEKKAGIISGDAALWGLGRTMMNESSYNSIRLVDLETPLSVDTVVTALEKEFKQPDDETEIVLTVRGERYAPRLNTVPRTENNSPIKSSMPTVSLGFEYPGQLRNLRWESSPRITPAADEVEVVVHATGLNFRDIMYTLGLLPDEAIENGFTGPNLGLEFTGVIETVGSDVHMFNPGDQVVGFGPSSFGNRLLTKASAICNIPPGLSFEAAATIPSTFFTAYYSLNYLARLQPGEKVLIHGAAGGVGLAAIQLAKWIGAEIYATAGSEQKHDFLRLLGVDHIFHSRRLSFADEILAMTNGEGVDVVLNSLAGEAINRNLKVLKPFGRFLELGKRDFYENTKIGLRPFRNNISYFGIDADQLMQSHPELTRRLFSEVMDLFSEGILHPLPYHLFEAENIIDAFRYMQQSRQIGKIVITYRKGINHVYTESPTKQKKLKLKKDTSYLITGGLGGFGLKTAEWLVTKGARNLILISRSGPVSGEAMEAIGRLKKQGVNILATACDVCDREALSSLLTEIAETFPPLKGIVHAATVINDGLINNMDADQLRSVLEPKVLGAYNLHELTAQLPLDYFILFSSATTLFGNPGQANYVAANACLDALANSRRDNGLPATCVRWGAIEDVGFLSRNKEIKEALQNRMGGAALHSSLALEILEEMLISDRSGFGVMELDWKALSRFLPSSTAPKYSELTRLVGESNLDEDNGENILHMLEELSDSELHSTVVEILQTEVGEILQIAPDRIDPTQSMYDMGLDSLMGVELVVALESRFGTKLPVMTLSQSPTIAKLAERIILKLKGIVEKDTASDEEDILTQVQMLATQHDADVTSGAIQNLAEDLDSQDTGKDDQIIR